jgi:hypothetical protein
MVHKYKAGFGAFVQVKIVLLGSFFSIFRPVQSKDIELVVPSVDSAAENPPESIVYSRLSAEGKSRTL